MTIKIRKWTLPENLDDIHDTGATYKIDPVIRCLVSNPGKLDLRKYWQDNANAAVARGRKALENGILWAIMAEHSTEEKRPMREYWAVRESQARSTARALDRFMHSTALLDEAPLAFQRAIRGYAHSRSIRSKRPADPEDVDRECQECEKILRDAIDLLVEISVDARARYDDPTNPGDPGRRMFVLAFVEYWVELFRQSPTYKDGMAQEYPFSDLIDADWEDAGQTIGEESFENTVKAAKKLMSPIHWSMLRARRKKNTSG